MWLGFTHFLHSFFYSHPSWLLRGFNVIETKHLHFRCPPLKDHLRVIFFLSYYPQQEFGHGHRVPQLQEAKSYSSNKKNTNNYLWRKKRCQNAKTKDEKKYPK
jgi:hypothetical protein